jgi:hypothetical protein
MTMAVENLLGKFKGEFQKVMRFLVMRNWSNQKKVDYGEFCVGAYSIPLAYGNPSPQMDGWIVKQVCCNAIAFVFVVRSGHPMCS